MSSSDGVDDWLILFPVGVWSAAETYLPWQSRNHDEGANTSVWTLPEGILQEWTLQKYSNTTDCIMDKCIYEKERVFPQYSS